MLALGFRFPAGSYHATPWGHHVNEAVIAWPPEPFRLIRALIAVWHRKMIDSKWSDGEFDRMLRGLAAAPPSYNTPPGIRAHSRHYMPVNEGRKEKKKLIFDAFLRLGRDEELVMAWPELELEKVSLELLDELLKRVGYLGRAESWVEARRLDDWKGAFNCYPCSDNFDPETGEVLGDLIALMRPLTPEEYDSFREHSLAQAREKKMKPAEMKKIAASLPESWIDAVAIDTSVIKAAGWNSPPAAREIEYLRPHDTLKANTAPKAIRPVSPSFSVARYSIYGKPLPRMEDSLRVGEWLRQAVMGKARRIFGEDGIPPLLSGHDMGKDNRHDHAFYLSEDADEDGQIDHLVVLVPAGMDAASQRVLSGLTRTWKREGDEYRLLLESIGDADDFDDASRLFLKASVHVSLTPYLHPWHVKKKFPVEDQIKKECSIRGLPELKKLERLETIRIGGRDLFPLHFHRFRSKRGLAQPDRQGSFWRLTFSEPVRGPLAIGFGCHFGLGLFASEEY